ncbi:hypothetical protein HDU96_011010 [Phlyctochytrium bullatum]|nr:hypothetical protein HDU96_011010 [Phlyctochytrium bullatum]
MPKRVILYHTNWSCYARNYQVKDLPIHFITDVNYCFFDLKPNGSGFLVPQSTDPWADVDKRYVTKEESVDPPDSWDQNDGVYGNIGQFIKLKKQGAQFKLGMSIGGWTLSKGFSSAVRTVESRKEFVNGIIEMLRKYPVFDRIDIDWEHISPLGKNYGDAGNEVHPDDPRNFGEFLKLLRETLNSNGFSSTEISACVVADPEKMQALPFAEMSIYLETINCMTSPLPSPKHLSTSSVKLDELTWRHLLSAKNTIITPETKNAAKNIATILLYAFIMVGLFLGLGILDFDDFERSRFWPGEASDGNEERYAPALSPMEGRSEIPNSIPEGRGGDSQPIGKASEKPFARVSTEDQLIIDPAFLQSLQDIAQTRANSSRTTKATDSTGQRYLPVSGFSYCKILENASFDMFVPVLPWDGQCLAERENPVADMIELLDSTAQRIFVDIALKETMRYACYSVAEGANTVAKLTEARWFHSLDPTNYFHNILPAMIQTNHTEGLLRKRFYKIAYLINIRSSDIEALPNVQNLIDEIDDGSAIVLVHIDADADAIYEEMQRFLDERLKETRATLSKELANEPGNVYLSKKRYKSVSKHISLVWILLNGYLELLDLAFWECVINLSPLDIPLRKSKEIYRVLSLPQNRGLNFISHWADFDKIALRMTRAHIGRQDLSPSEKATYHPRETGLMMPPFKNWKLCQQSPWMILSREVPRIIRKSQEAHIILAYMEHTLKPDETFFCYVLTNTQGLRMRIHNDNKRFIRNNLLTINDTNDLGWPTSSAGYVDMEMSDPRYFFIGNADVRTEGGWRLWEWAQRHHVQRYVQKPDAYGRPLLNGRSTLVDAVPASSSRVPKPAASVSVDPDVLDDFRKDNFAWKLAGISLHVILLLPGLLFLLFCIRPRWDDVPSHLLFGTTKETCRFLLLFTGWFGIIFALLGWRHLRPPVTPSTSFTTPHFLGPPSARRNAPATTRARLSTGPALPLSHIQWVALRDSYLAGDFPDVPPPGDLAADRKLNPVERAAQTATWWAEHPVSLSQRSEFSVRVWLFWTATASLLAQAFLISGFLFPFLDIDTWPYALIPLSLLFLSPFIALLVVGLLDRGLRLAPLEDRGVAEGLQVAGLDVVTDLTREKAKFDPCESFPEPVAYFFGDVLSFFCLL